MKAEDIAKLPPSKRIVPLLKDMAPTLVFAIAALMIYGAATIVSLLAWLIWAVLT